MSAQDRIDRFKERFEAWVDDPKAGYDALIDLTTDFVFEEESADGSPTHGVVQAEPNTGRQD